MALTARTPTTAATNLFVPAIYLNKVIEAAKSSLVNLDAVNNEWVSGVSKGNVFYLPKTNTVTATEVVVGTKGTALNHLNTTGVTVTMNQFYEAPIDIDTMTNTQTQVEREMFAKTEAAYAVQASIDLYISSLYSSLNGSTVKGTDGTAIDDDLLIDLMELLDEANAKRDGRRSLILDPSAVADMMKFDKFVSAAYVGAAGAVSNGMVMNGHPIYGCGVRVTNNLTAASVGNYCVMMHADCIAAKVQIQNAWVKEFEELHQIRYHCDALYGASEAQDAMGIPFYSRKA